MILLLLILAADPLYQRPEDPAQLTALLQTQIAAGNVQDTFWLEKIALYTRLGELDSLNELIELLSEHRPDQPVYLEAKMIGAGSAGRVQEALALGEQLLERFPNYPTIRVNLAKLYVRADRAGDAVNLLLTDLDQTRESDHHWVTIMTLLQQHRPANLYQRLSEKNQQFPQSLALQRLMLAVLVRDGAYDRAVSWLDQHPKLGDDPELKHFIAALNQFKGTK